MFKSSYNLQYLNTFNVVYILSSIKVTNQSSTINTLTATVRGSTTSCGANQPDWTEKVCIFQQ